VKGVEGLGSRENLNPEDRGDDEQNPRCRDPASEFSQPAKRLAVAGDGGAWPCVLRSHLPEHLTRHFGHPLPPPSDDVEFLQAVQYYGKHPNFVNSIRKEPQTSASNGQTLTGRARLPWSRTGDGGSRSRHVASVDLRPFPLQGPASAGAGGLCG